MGKTPQQEEEGSAETPHQMNSNTQTKAHKPSPQTQKEDVKVTQTMINQNALQATIYGGKFAQRYNFWAFVQLTIGNPEKALQQGIKKFHLDERD